VRRKNRWQIKRERGIAAARRMNAGKARLRMERPAPEYPQIIDSSVPFLRVTIESAAGAERWAIYPGKRRAHRVEIDGEDWIVGNRPRHSISAIYAELRKRGAIVERGLRLPLAAETARGTGDPS
jgi:translation initiation factor IF-1